MRRFSDGYYGSMVYIYLSIPVYIYTKYPHVSIHTGFPMLYFQGQGSSSLESYALLPGEIIDSTSDFLCSTSDLSYALLKRDYIVGEMYKC